MKVAPAKAACKRLHRDKRGAALVEFIVAFMPLMTTFLCFCQLSSVAIAGLLVKHSAIIGARAAAVMSARNNNNPGESGSADYLVKEGVKAALGPWQRRMSKVDVQINDRSSIDDPYGPVTVTVTAAVNCFVPIGNFAVCQGTSRQFVESVTFPHQGARYKDEGASGSGSGAGGGGGGGGGW